MHMNMKMGFNNPPQNKKEAAKLAQKKVDDYKAVANHADYQAKQEHVEAPFGKAFKTGAHIDKKKEFKRGDVKHKGKGWD